MNQNLGEKNEKYIDYFKLAKKKRKFTNLMWAVQKRCRSKRSSGENGFVEHLEENKIAGKIYAANVMDAGLVKNQSVFKTAYDMGYSI